MTTQQIARLYRARRSGRGKWTARCPIHRDRMASLEIKEGRKGGSTIIGCYAGCAKADILAAKGLGFKDLFADSGFKPSPAMRQVWADEERLALMERRNGLAIMAQAVMPEERRYWAAVERNSALEIRRLRDKLYPSEKKDRERNEETQRIIAEYGLDELVECLPCLKP
jgi:hypothetical protein